MEKAATPRGSWDLQLQTSTSTSTSPASSNGSPTHEYGGPTGRGVAKTPLDNVWQLPSTEYKFTLSDSQFNNPFSATSQNLPDELPGQSATPPILVPSPKTQAAGPTILEQNAIVNDRTYVDVSPLEESFRSGRTSISFNPKVTLDCGCETKLDEPVPKAVTGRPRGRSLLAELSKATESQSSLHRAQSDSDRRHYDAVTGELLLRKREAWKDTKQKPWISLGEPRHPLLQSTVDALARNPELDQKDRMASLTSGSTASAVTEQVHTPTESPVEFTLSPMVRPSPLRHPTSLETSSAWPMRRPSPSPFRAKSYTLEPAHLRRSQRGTMGSRRSSTASSFLSTFGTTAVAVVEPDAEGQEVCDYVLGKQIGYGGFSVVKQAFTIDGTLQVTRAVKIVRKRISGKSDRENEQAQAEFEHEVSIWRILSHKHVLPLIAVYDTPFATYCFMPMNVGGSLYDLIRTQRHGISGPLARRYSFQLASALQYLHEDVHIAHRDIKLENCLLDMSSPGPAGGGNVLLCDFGMAEFTTNEGGEGARDASSVDPYERSADRPPPKIMGPSATSTSIAGSLQYAPPELIMSQVGLYSTAVDMWAYGVVVYALLVGNLPFQHTFLPKLQMMILKGEWSELALREAPGLGGGVYDALDLIRGCLDMSAVSRWTVRQVLESGWLEGCQAADDVAVVSEAEPGWRIEDD